MQGAFTDGDLTVSAELTFDANHDLVNFVSADRLRASTDGTSFTPQVWSTPWPNIETPTVAGSW